MLSTTEIARIGLKWLKTWDLKPVWSGKSQLPCSQPLRLHILASSDSGLRTWDPVWSGKSRLPCSQRLRSQGLASSDLGLRTWDPCEVVSPDFHALNGWDHTDWPQVTWDLGLRIPFEVVSHDFHALNGWDHTDWPQVTWDLGPVWTGPSVYCVKYSEVEKYLCTVHIDTSANNWSKIPAGGLELWVYGDHQWCLSVALFGYNHTLPVFDSASREN